MPLYNPLNNRETKPGLCTGSKSPVISQHSRLDPIQGRGPPGKQSPAGGRQAPGQAQTLPGNPWTQARPRDVAAVQRRRSAPPGSPRRGNASNRENPGTPGPRPHTDPRARTRAPRAPGRRPPAPRPREPRSSHPAAAADRYRASRNAAGPQPSARPGPQSCSGRWTHHHGVAVGHRPRHVPAASGGDAAAAAAARARGSRLAGAGPRRASAVEGARARPGGGGEVSGGGKAGGTEVAHRGRRTVARAAARRSRVAFKGGRALFGDRAPGTGRGRGRASTACSASPARRPLDGGWRPRGR